MATDVILPRVDMDMTTGRISHWYVKPGEAIEKGQPLFEIETDKAAMEIEAPASGRVQIIVNTGTQVPVGSTVGWILAEGEAEIGAVSAPGPTPDAAPTAADLATAEEVWGNAAPNAEPAPIVASASSDIRATPLSRRLAAQHGLDLADITGSGPKGRIQADDVTAFAAKTSALPFVSTGFLNGTWLRQGPGDPIVMIHGFGSDLGGWRPFVQGLPATLPIYALDLPGHGGSALGNVKDIGDVVTQVVAALKAAGITGGHLVGHSLGGAVAALVMARGDFQAKSLFLIAPGGLGPEVNALFIKGFAAASNEAQLGVWMSELVEDLAVMTAALVKATAKARAGTTIPDSQAKIAAALFAGDAQSFSVLSALKSPPVPTRVVFGRADRIIPASHAQRLSGHVAVHLFAGVGHLPHYEVRDAVAALLLQHMKSAG